MADDYEFKQGRNFAIVVALDDCVEDGAYNEWTATAQVRRYDNNLPSGKLADLTVINNDPTVSKVFTLMTDAPTDNWPVGKIEVDLRLESADGSSIAYTETLCLTVVRSVTKRT